MTDLTRKSPPPRQSSLRAKFIAAVEAHARARGFTAGPTGGQGSQDSAAGAVWAPLDFSSTQGVAEAARTLASFHQAVRGLSPAPYFRRAQRSAAKTLVHDWRKILSGIAEEFESLVKDIEADQDHSRFDTALVDVWPHLDARIKRSLEYFNGRRYRKLARSSLASGTVVAGREAVHGLCLDTEGRVRVPSYSGVKFGTKVSDVYYLIMDVVDVAGWKFRTIATAVKAYSSIEPLSKDDVELLAALMEFPMPEYSLARAWYGEAFEGSEKRAARLMRSLHHGMREVQEFVAGCVLPEGQEVPAKAHESSSPAESEGQGTPGPDPASEG